MDYAIITGASKGIGKAIAIELARRRRNLLLTARSESLLAKLAADLRREYGVKVEYKALDLADPDSAGALAAWCTANNYSVSVLVNNAGFGLWGDFEDLPLNGQLEMMNLNMNALVALTHHFLPLLSKSKRSYILNVASLASFLAIPRFSIYAASKAFVLSFSRSLRHEVAGQGISVSCLCPGATESEFLDRAGMQTIGDKAAGVYMTAEAVANIGVKGMLRGKAEIVPGVLNKLASGSMKLTPRSISEAVAGRLYKDRE